jgi:hypothetical protein
MRGLYRSRGGQLSPTGVQAIAKSVFVLSSVVYYSGAPEEKWSWLPGSIVARQVNFIQQKKVSVHKTFQI